MLWVGGNVENWMARACDACCNAVMWVKHVLVVAVESSWKDPAIFDMDVDSFFAGRVEEDTSDR